MSLKLTTFFFLLLATLSQAQIQCPSKLCFCSKTTAKFVCDIPLLSGRCEVGKCTSTQCSNDSYRCQPKITPGVGGILTPELIAAIRAQLEAKGGCKGNVCFAIDGSGSIDASEYAMQLKFVADVVNIISTFDTRVAGTQYSDKSYPIKSLSDDLNGFIAAMLTQTQVRKSTSISSGIDYCGKEVDTRPFEPKKVVVLGDGFQTADQKALASATKVWNNNGVVSVVYVPPASLKFLRQLVFNDNSLLFNAENFNAKESDRLGYVIGNLTLAICAPDTS